MTENTEHIIVTWTPDGLWGTEDPEQYDWRKWEARHQEILEAKLREAYPDAEIEVRKGGDYTEINGRRGLREADFVAAIESEAYEQWLDEICEDESDFKVVRAIMVTEDNGVYQIHPNAEPEDWGEVQLNAEHVTHIESLVGWAPYTSAYRVTIHKLQPDIFYFVAE